MVHGINGPKDWSPSMKVAIKVNAKNDSNGNPRRGWVIVSCRNGNVEDFVDEGYSGRSELRRQHPQAAEGPELLVLPGEYRDLKRRFSDKKNELGKGGTMAKVKGSVPPVLAAWVTCRRVSGVKPGVKMTAKQKAEARSCVARQLRNKKK